MEADAGSRSVNYEEFMNMRLENKVFCSHIITVTHMGMM